jgi:hypothetical protein
MRNLIRTIAVVSSILAVTGCASNRYVRHDVAETTERIEKLWDRFEHTDQRDRRQPVELTKVDARAEQVGLSRTQSIAPSGASLNVADSVDRTLP